VDAISQALKRSFSFATVPIEVNDGAIMIANLVVQASSNVRESRRLVMER
jgi:hypothetical protein